MKRKFGAQNNKDLGTASQTLLTEVKLRRRRRVVVQTSDKLANTRNRRFQSCKIYSSSFDKFYVNIACCEDIYGRRCIQKSDNFHFHTLFVIIVFISSV